MTRCACGKGVVPDGDELCRACVEFVRREDDLCEQAAKVVDLISTREPNAGYELRRLIRMEMGCETST